MKITFLLINSLLALMVASCNNNADDTAAGALPDAGPAKLPAEIKYGYSLDSFDLEEGKVAPGQFLADLLAPHIDPGKAALLAHQCKETFDVRKMKAGKIYYKFCSKKDNGLCGFVYIDNPIDYYVFTFTDSVPVVAHHQNEVVTDTIETGGIINGSLWAAMTEKGNDPALAVELSEVFGWQVDFFRVQKGDKYRVIYEEKSVAGKPYGIGKILGACFTHRGEDFYAIRFQKGDFIGYYDHEGKSMKKQFLKSPLEYSRISSNFSLRRFHPVQKIWKPHLGTDYAAPTGTPIRTVGDGVIEKAGYTAGNGKYVKVKHNSTYATQYLHMSKIANGMTPGKRVSQGQVIGYVGSTGLATGPHLCFRFWKNNQQVNALKVIAPPAEPLTKEYLSEYLEKSSAIIDKLEKIEIEEPTLPAQHAIIMAP